MQKLDKDDQLLDPMANYNVLVQTLHEKIDDVFNTNQAQNYATDANESALTMGMLPPPAAISEPALDLKKLRDAGKAFDRADLTTAGRALDKHGNRPNPIFPKAYGSPTQKNAQGQIILEEILADPNKEVLSTRQGGIKIYSSNGRGAHFDKEGNLIGFVEKRYER